MSRIHLYLPSLFPNPAAFPYIDAFATVMGFVAATLSAHRKIESWLLWICVDCICIGLYYARNVKFVAVLYIFFLALAINGLITWTSPIPKKLGVVLIPLYSAAYIYFAVNILRKQCFDECIGVEFGDVLRLFA